MAWTATRMRWDGCRLGLFRAVDKDGIEVGGDQGDLVVEVLLAGGFEVLLAALGGPFRLCDCAVTGEVRFDGFEGDAAVACDGARRAEQFIGVNTVAGELNDIDVVTPAGAGDAAFEDGDALLGDGGLGRVTEERDRVAEDPVDGHLPGRRHDRVSGGDIPERGARPRSDRHGDPHPLARVGGLLADLPAR